MTDSKSDRRGVLAGLGSLAALALVAGATGAGARTLADIRRERSQPRTHPLARIRRQRRESEALRERLENDPRLRRERHRVRSPEPRSGN